MVANIICYLPHANHITFPDTDDYMRLVRIKDFFLHHDLSNTIIARSNVPFGCDLHWTRFYDFFIIIPVYILNIFINSIDRSIEYVGFSIGPIIKSVSVVVFFSVCQKFIRKNNAFLVAAIFSGHPMIFSIGAPGRADHHAFIMLFIIIYLKTIIEVIESGFMDKNLCLKSAIVAVLCIWISPETLIPILLIDGILFIHSFFPMEKLKFLHRKNTLIACGICPIVFSFFHQISNCIFALGTLLTVVPYAAYHEKYIQNCVFKYWHIVVIMLILASFSITRPIEYDQISTVHIALFVCSALYFGINIVYRKLELKCRIITSAVWFMVIGAVFLVLYPKFMSGMSADIDDYVKKIWLQRVEELQSPLVGENKWDFVIYCTFLIISIASKVKRLMKKKFTSEGLIWSILIINAVCYTIFAGIACRMLPYAALFGLPLIVDFAMNDNFFKSFYRLSKVVIAIFLSTYFLFFTAYLNHKKESNPLSPSYIQKELFKKIDNLSPKPVVIMAHTNDGPALLYYTKHSVVGAPYHRQTEGIISSYKIMEDEYNEEIAETIMKTTNSAYIFIRKNIYTKKPKNHKSLAQRIIDNDLPDWISILELPEKFSDVVIAKIDLKKLKSAK